MAQAQLSAEEIGRRGRILYEKVVRRKVETPQNVGKLLVIDVETGDYEVSENGLESARRLQAKRPNAALYGIRIGYTVSEALGGVRDRTRS